MGRLQSALSRIEHRLRDDDHGAVTAADSLVELLLPTIMDGEAPPQLRLELAAARQQVGAVFAARARFVDRFKCALETEQIEKERRKGRAVTWVRTAARAGDEDEGVLEELVVFVRAMMTRSRLATCTARGDPRRRGLRADRPAAAADDRGRAPQRVLRPAQPCPGAGHSRPRQPLLAAAPDGARRRRRARPCRDAVSRLGDGRCIGTRLPERATPVAIPVTAEDLAEALDAEPVS